MSDSVSDIENRARQYCTARGIQMERRLGFGRDGSVYATSAGTAVKAHGRRETFERELLCYIRLRTHAVEHILGHRVPQLLDADEQLMVIEMSIVKRPFLLDFASAYLHAAPVFPEETMEEWRREKIEQFGDRWPQVEAVLDVLRSQLGIHLLDIHPWNIAFEKEEGRRPRIPGSRSPAPLKHGLEW